MKKRLSGEKIFQAVDVIIMCIFMILIVTEPTTYRFW